MSTMTAWVVIDTSSLENVYGPFATKDDAEEWLAQQGIYIGQYEEQEVSVRPLQPVSERLEVI